jgi:transcriptional regulator with PAS, ATPase and Fis domain
MTLLVLTAPQQDLRQAERGEPHQNRKLDPFLGISPAIRRLAAAAEQVLTSEHPVLLLGETGAGKNVLANWLHERSGRSGDFVDLNCAGLSSDLLESEVFGHERGAFTGAVGAKPGLLEVADGGSLFLDEIGDMDVRVQAKLLKVVEEQRFRRLGDVKCRQVDVRLIAATHENLGAAVKQKRFRADFYYRISTLPLHVPSLRERAQDVPVLAAYFLREHARRRARGAAELSTAALKALCEYDWPGNIRELVSVIERAMLKCQGGVIHPEHLSLEGIGGTVPPAAPAANLTLEQVKLRHIEKVLEEEHYHVDQAARRLGMPKSTLYQELKRLGIRRSRAR